MIWKGIMRWIR